MHFSVPFVYLFRRLPNSLTELPQLIVPGMRLQTFLARLKREGRLYLTSYKGLIRQGIPEVHN